MVSKANWVDRFIHASLWSAGTSYIFFALNFLGQLVLARFLLPADFGLYAYMFALRDLLLIVIGFASVQSFLYTDASQAEFNANAVINLASCCIITLIGIVGVLIFGLQHHWLSGLFFIALMCAQSFTIMSYLYLAPLEKELKYKVVSLQQGMAGVAGMIFAIALAYRFHSAWSLVLRDVFTGVMAFLLAYRVAPKKIQGKIQWNLVKEQFIFGAKTAVARALETLFYRFPDVAVQYFFGRIALGNFYQARYLCNLPIKILTPFIQQALFVFLTNIRDNKAEMASKLYWINYIVLLLTLPAIFAMYLWGKEIMILLYGAKWINAGIYFSYFSLFVLFGVLFYMLQLACYSLALQKHVSIGFLIGIAVFLMGLVVARQPQYSALSFSIGFVAAYAYLVWVFKRRGIHLSMLKLYSLPIVMTLIIVMAGILKSMLLQIIIYVLLMLFYLIFERKQLLYLIRRILKVKLK